MQRSLLLQAVGLVVILISVTVVPTLVLAQHGGGFHGGGVHYGGAGHGWHGGSAWHGGYGWHGGYWSYPYYGYSWGVSIGFSWGYPYAYGYGAWMPNPFYYAPYYYVPSYYGPRGYVRCCSSDKNSDPQGDPPSARKPISGESAGSPENESAARFEPEASTGRPRRPSPREMSSYRRPVQNAIRALLAMPPEARRRQLDSGRYANFSAGERALLAQVSVPTRVTRTR